MPYIIANVFSTGAKLDALKNIQVDQSNTKYQAITDNEITLIKDILTLTVAYDENFANMPRLTDASKADYGKIDPAYTITSKNMTVQSLEGKDPIKSIDGLIGRYMREHSIVDPADNEKESVQ